MIKEIPYNTIDKLVEAFFDTYTEDPIFKNLNHVRKKGYLTKKELIEIGMWKSARPKKFYEMNSHEEVKEITSLAFNVISESHKIKLLTKLHGVRIPTASAILAIFQPEKYGVIDIRVWQTLYYYGLVITNKEGTNFSIENWLDLILILRNLAEKHKTTPRTIERALFSAHKEFQIGTLYSKPKQKAEDILPEKGLLTKVKKRKNGKPTLIDTMNYLIGTGKYTLGQLITMCIKKYPDYSRLTIATYLTDCKNPKYNRLQNLVTTGQNGEMHFIHK